MSVTCIHCGAENMAPGVCQRCGQRLPQICPQCGSTNKPNVQYCGGCGFQFAAPGPSQDRTVQQSGTMPFNSGPAPQPQFPQYGPVPGPGPQPGPMNPPNFPPPAFTTPPYAQPQKKGSRVWGIIGGIAGGIVVVLGLAIWGLAKLAPDTPPVDNPTDNPPQTDQKAQGQGQGQGQGQQTNPPNNPQPPAQNKNNGLEVEPGKFANVKVVAQGDFQRTFSVIDARAGFVAAGKGNSAQLYQVKQDGSMQLIKDITPDGVGNLVQVHVGDMLNGGTLGMVAVYEKALYFVDANGNSTGYKANVKDAVVADIDGDGKFETLLQADASDGTNTVTVLRFNGKQQDQVAAVKGLPNQGFDYSNLIMNKRALLFNAQAVSGGIQFTLYNWDNTKGPVQLVQHLAPADPNHPAEFATSGIFGAAGSTFVVSRSGSPASLEIIEVTDSDAKSIGAVALPGSGRYMVTLATLTGSDWDLLAVDENGHYYILSLQ